MLSILAVGTTLQLVSQPALAEEAVPLKKHISESPLLHPLMFEALSRDLRLGGHQVKAIP